MHTENVRSERLDTARLVGRMMRDQAFRESLPPAETGEHRVISASLDETLGEVFHRIDDLGLPVTVCVRLGTTGLASLLLSETTDADNEYDHQECGIDATLGTLVGFLAQHRAPLCISLGPGLRTVNDGRHLALAFA